MCLGVPAEVVELIDDDWATVNVGGVQKRVSIALLDRIEVGWYVIVHAGFALGGIDLAEALKTLEEMTSALDEELPAMKTITLH